MQAGGRGTHFLIPFLWLVVSGYLEHGAAEVFARLDLGRSAVRAVVSWVVFALPAAGTDPVEQEELTAGSG